MGRSSSTCMNNLIVLNNNKLIQLDQCDMCAALKRLCIYVWVFSLFYMNLVLYNKRILFSLINAYFLLDVIYVFVLSQWNAQTHAGIPPRTATCILCCLHWRLVSACVCVACKQNTKDLSVTRGRSSSQTHTHTHSSVNTQIPASNIGWL